MHSVISDRFQGHSDAVNRNKLERKHWQATSGIRYLPKHRVRHDRQHRIPLNPPPLSRRKNQVCHRLRAIDRQPSWSKFFEHLGIERRNIDINVRQPHQAQIPPALKDQHFSPDRPKRQECASILFPARFIQNSALIKANEGVYAYIYQKNRNTMSRPLNSGYSYKFYFLRNGDHDGSMA